MYKNSEGYSDPTAGAAMSSMMKEYRQIRKKVWQRQNEMKTRKKVYVASRYAGDVEANTAAALDYCRYVINENCIPVASHIFYAASGMLNDNSEEERELGLMFGLSLLAVCDEIWVFGEVSAGMQQEITEAKKLGKRVRYMKEGI
ncbi:Uncharacterised protein [uncultured Clostridium sp.]|nr:Uncharacterised protein [uncultured Clostridium sp.]